MPVGVRVRAGVHEGRSGAAGVCWRGDRPRGRLHRILAVLQRQNEAALFRGRHEGQPAVTIGVDDDDSCV